MLFPTLTSGELCFDIVPLRDAELDAGADAEVALETAQDYEVFLGRFRNDDQNLNAMKRALDNHVERWGGDAHGVSRGGAGEHALIMLLAEHCATGALKLIAREPLRFDVVPFGESTEEPVVPESDNEKEPVSWIEVQLVDHDDEPVAGELCRLELPDGTEWEGRTDTRGVLRVSGIDPGNCTITFPNLDRRLWERAWRHKVQQGEHIAGLARQHGLLPETIWEHPENEALRDKRKTPHILHPGDVVFIPERELHIETGATEKRHRFRVMKPTVTVRVVLRDELGEPLDGIDYRLTARGAPEISGTTAADGMVEGTFSADVTRASLQFLGRELSLSVGTLNPISRISGVQQRLNNLRFDSGPIDGIIGPLTRGAIRRFQLVAGLPPSGIADEETRDALESMHDGTPRKLAIEEEDDDPPEDPEDDEEDDDFEDEDEDDESDEGDDEEADWPLLHQMGHEDEEEHDDDFDEDEDDFDEDEDDFDEDEDDFDEDEDDFDEDEDDFDEDEDDFDEDDERRRRRRRRRGGDMTRGTSVATATSSGADEHGSVRSLYTVCVRFHHIATGRPLKAAVAVQPETTAKLQAQLDTRATHPFIVEDEAPIQFRRSMDYGDYEVSIKALRVAERSVKRGKTVFSTLTWRVPECFVPKRDALPIITNAGNHYVELDDRKKLYVCVQTGDGKLARRALITRLDGVLEIPLTPDQWKKGTTLTLKLRDYKVLDVKEAIEPAEYTPSWEKVTLNGKPVDNDWKLKTADGEVSFKDETTLEIGPEDAKHDEHSEAFDLRGGRPCLLGNPPSDDLRRAAISARLEDQTSWRAQAKGGDDSLQQRRRSTSEKFEAERGQERLSIVASGKRSLRRVQKRGAGNWSRQKTTYRDGDLEEPNFAQECRLEFELRLIMAHLWHTEVHGCTTAIASGPKKIAYHEKRVAKAARRVARAEERVAKREARVEEAEAKCKEKPKSRSAKKKLRAARRKLRWAKRAEKRAKTASG